jgi:hypothetical protein
MNVLWQKCASTKHAAGVDDCKRIILGMVRPTARLSSSGPFHHGGLLKDGRWQELF